MRGLGQGPSLSPGLGLGPSLGLGLGPGLGPNLDLSPGPGPGLGPGLGLGLGPGLCLSPRGISQGRKLCLGTKEFLQIELLMPRQMLGPKTKLRKKGWEELERQLQTRYVHVG